MSTELSAGMPRRVKTELIVVHCTATPPNYAGGVAGIEAMHLARGFSAIGYNELILPGGEWVEGRGTHAVGAHARGYNSRAIGIALVGGVDEDGAADASTFDAGQWATLERRLGELARLFPGAKICGHRDLSPDLDGDGVIEPHEWVKLCPCFDAIPWAASKGLPVAAINGAWGPRDPRRPQPADSRTEYLQRLLKNAGFDPGPDDGIAGRRTVAAVRAYQAARGLPVTGALDRVTVAELRAEIEGGPVAPQTVTERVTPKDRAAVGSWALGGLAAFAAWFGGLDPLVQAAIIVGVAAALGLVVRALWQRNRETALERAGDVLPEAEPDWLDWALAWARAALLALWERAQTWLGGLLAGLRAPAATDDGGRA